MRVCEEATRTGSDAVGSRVLDVLDLEGVLARARHPRMLPPAVNYQHRATVRDARPASTSARSICLVRLRIRSSQVATDSRAAIRAASVLSNSGTVTPVSAARRAKLAELLRYGACA